MHSEARWCLQKCPYLECLKLYVRRSLLGM